MLRNYYIELFAEVGIDIVKQWVAVDLLGALNSFFQMCNTPDFLWDMEVICITACPLIPHEYFHTLG